eukprot:SAG22_NODE_1249_length_5012_cov_1.781396_1_plen_67_part_10
MVLYIPYIYVYLYFWQAHPDLVRAGELEAVPSVRRLLPRGPLGRNLAMMLSVAATIATAAAATAAAA